MYFSDTYLNYWSSIQFLSLSEPRSRSVSGGNLVYKFQGRRHLLITRGLTKEIEERGLPQITVNYVDESADTFHEEHIQPSPCETGEHPGYTGQLGEHPSHPGEHPDHPVQLEEHPGYPGPPGEHPGLPSEPVDRLSEPGLSVSMDKLNLCDSCIRFEEAECRLWHGSDRVHFSTETSDRQTVRSRPIPDSNSIPKKSSLSSSSGRRKSISCPQLIDVLLAQDGQAEDVARIEDELPGDYNTQEAYIYITCKICKIGDIYCGKY